MAVSSFTAAGRQVFVGLSSDAKPKNQVLFGSLFFEADTQKRSVFESDGNWYLYTESAALYDAAGNALGSTQGNLNAQVWIYQPSTLSYILATADSFGNLNVTAGTASTTPTSALGPVDMSQAIPVAIAQDQVVPVRIAGDNTVQVSNFPPGFTITGTVSDLTTPPLGQALSATSLPVVLAADQSPIQVFAVDPLATASRQDVLIAALQQLVQQILNCDTTNVTVSSGNVVVSNLPLVQVVSGSGTFQVIPVALEPNASQETGGNLDQITANLIALSQKIENLTNITQQSLTNIASLLGGAGSIQ